MNTVFLKNVVSPPKKFTNDEVTCLENNIYTSLGCVVCDIYVNINWRSFFHAQVKASQFRFYLFSLVRFFYKIYVTFKIKFFAYTCFLHVSYLILFNFVLHVIFYIAINIFVLLLNILKLIFYDFFQ